MVTATLLHGTREGAPRPSALVPRVELVDEGSCPEWDAFVEQHPDANLYHLRAWKVVAETSYRLSAPFLVARDRAGDVIRGVLPLVRVPRPLSPYLTTGIFGAYGAVLADHERHARALLAAARDYVDRGEVDYLHLKLLGDIPAETGLERHDHWVTAVLELGTDVDALRKRQSSNVRWSVRHAEREGLTVVRGPGEVDAFYDVLAENMLRKGSPIYGRAFFHDLLGTLGPRADVLTLRHAGRTVSGAFLAWFRDVMYVPFASSRPAVFSLRANHLLFWEAAKRALELGLTKLDFGSSLRASTGLDFKLGFRPRVIPIGSYVYARKGMVPALVPADSAIARRTVRLWSRLPPRVAEALGPKVCRWIA